MFQQRNGAAARLQLLLSSDWIVVLKLTCELAKSGVALNRQNRVLPVASDALGLGELRRRRPGSHSGSLLLQAGC